MNKDLIAKNQRRIGVKDDGFWGSVSIEACKNYLRNLMPSPNPWPKTDSVSLSQFYGAPGDESNLVSLPAPVLMAYEGVAIKTIRVNKRCAESLSRALTEAFKVAPAIVSVYDGCFNNRLKRGGSTPSLHAYGAAIDLSADLNDFHSNWPLVASMPLEVMECFAREGWISAGAFWGYDAMHFQATR